MTYNRLGLPFTSPLVNIYWDRDKYSLFIQDPLFYLNTELQMVSDGDIKKEFGRLESLGMWKEPSLFNLLIVLVLLMLRNNGIEGKLE